jgi:dihydroorotate dehydrogenase
LQAYTGFVYGGPLWPHRVQAGLARRIRDAGFISLQQAVGTGPPDRHQGSPDHGTWLSS